MEDTQLFFAWAILLLLFRACWLLAGANEHIRKQTRMMKKTRKMLAGQDEYRELHTKFMEAAMPMLQPPKQKEDADAAFLHRPNDDHVQAPPPRVDAEDGEHF